MKHIFYGVRLAVITLAWCVGMAVPIRVAEAAVFDGTGAWPTGGDVEIPANTKVVVADANVADVAGWSTLKLNTGSRLTFANAANVATLNAKCSGSGVIAAVDSCGLSILGDNSAMRYTACFIFTNSIVCVSNEFGLGSSITGTSSHPIGTNVKGAFVHFGPKSELHFGLADRKSFTNHCAITFNCDDDVTTMVFGSDAPDEYFVQDADFLHYRVHQKRPVYFRNNFQIISGVFPLRSRRGNVLHFYEVGSNVTVRISENTVVDASGGHDTLRDGLYWMADCDVWFEQSRAPVLGLFADRAGRVNIGADGAFDGIRELSGYFQETSLANPQRYFDLHGHDISVGTLTSPYGNAPMSTSTKFHVIRSSEPAKVKLTGYGTSSYNASHAFAFLGQTSFEMADSISTNAFCTVISDTSGDLIVSAGTVEFKWNAGWGGESGNVIVRGTGVLDINSSNAFLGNKKDLVVVESGKVIVRNGGAATFKTAVLGGKRLQKGSHTILKLKADLATAPFVDGDEAAFVNVLEGPHGLIIIFR